MGLFHDTVPARRSSVLLDILVIPLGNLEPETVDRYFFFTTRLRFQMSQAGTKAGTEPASDWSIQTDRRPLIGPHTKRAVPSATTFHTGVATVSYSGESDSVLYFSSHFH